MYKPDDYVVYRKDICKIKDIEENYLNDEDYYILKSVSDPTLKINIPISKSNNLLRDLISKDEIEKIINEIPNIEMIKTNDKFLEHEYKELMNSGTHRDLIKIIKTTYMRNKQRAESKKRIAEIDSTYFELAEKYLYNEFSIVLDLSFDDTKKYIIKKVEEQTAH